MTPWTVAHRDPQSVGFSRQAYWGGLPFTSPGDIPNPGIKPGSPALQADTLPSELSGKPIFLKSQMGAQCLNAELKQMVKKTTGSKPAGGPTVLSLKSLPH